MSRNKTTGSPNPTALESCVHYMAAEFGLKMIRVNSLSPGPISTRATSGIGHFDILMNRAVELAPEHHLVSLEEVGAFAAFLVCDGAKSITAGIHYVDRGYHIVG